MPTPMRIRLAFRGWIILPALLAGSRSVAAQAAPKPVTLLNVSYDPTRELYEDFNRQFATYWKGKTGQDVTVRQSLGAGL
jgi:sulfate/thiosulfate transport system substrate-binding protein